jgi:uncharacterized cupin superfamily protein
VDRRHAHPLAAGDLAAWPSGTGITHGIVNNSDRDAIVISCGEQEKVGSRICYPLHPAKKNELPATDWWDDAPRRELADGAPRPPSIVSAATVAERRWAYPGSDEPLAFCRSLGHAAGLTAIGFNLIRLEPGTRSSWPHCEENEEEFAYVVEGRVDAWVDGHLHPMAPGDLIAWPAGTGICHTIINNSDGEAVLISGGEAAKPGSRIYYPLNPSRRDDLRPAEWWHDVPRRELGPHDGLPDARRR